MEKRILLVEGDARFREVFTHALRLALAPEQFDVAFVEAAGSLAEAREQLREDTLDAALIDVTLPDGNGLDLVGEINNGADNRIPTLVLAANLDSSVAARAMASGAKGALSKVLSMPQTVEAVKRLTNAGRSEG